MVLRDRKQLAKLMVIQGVSQRQLAEAIGWKSHSYIGRIIRGEITSVDPDAAARLAVFFGVGVDDLFLPRASTVSANSSQRRAGTKVA